MPKLEMLAALTVIEKYANYLLGNEFLLQINNQALEWIFTMGMHSNALAMRWITRLQEFLFDTNSREKEFTALTVTKKRNSRRVDIRPGIVSGQALGLLS